MQLRAAWAAGIAVILLVAGCGTASTSLDATSAPPPAVAPPPDTAAPAPSPQPEPAPPPDTAAPAPSPQPEPAPPPDTAAPAPVEEPAPAPAPVVDDSPRDVLVALLAGVRTAAENSASYEREDYEHDRAYLCDSSGVDPYTGLAFDASSCDVDHIVAAKEAHESGGYNWAVATREQFGNDALNLVASRDCVNRSKGSSDAAEWSGVRSGSCDGAQLTAVGHCFWAARTVAVKHRYDLAVDATERAALESALAQCPADIDVEMPPRATLTTLPATEASPPPPPTTEAPTASSDCHPAYEPCLPNLPGDALNCGDLSADQRPIRVLQIGVDPYRLDRDGDGRGCTG